jgi:hypothetical protein
VVLPDPRSRQGGGAGGGTSPRGLETHRCPRAVPLKRCDLERRCLPGRLVLGERRLGPDQVRELHQRQEAPEGRQPLRALSVRRLVSAVIRGGRCAPAAARPAFAPCVRRRFALRSCVTIGVTSLRLGRCSIPANPIGGPGWFFNRFLFAQCTNQEVESDADGEFHIP